MSEHKLHSCNKKIYKNGLHIATIEAGPEETDIWVRAVAKKSGALVDWFCFRGMNYILHLGDKESQTRVVAVMKELGPTLRGKIVHIFF